MKKQVIQSHSPRDALVAVAKRLSRYEGDSGLDSEEFFARYTKGEIDDEARFIDWANDYRHYLGLRNELDRMLDEFQHHGSIE